MKKKSIVLTANTSWFIYNFHFDLLKELSNDFDIYCLLPKDDFYNMISLPNVKILPIKIYSSSLNPFKDFFLFMQYVYYFSWIRPSVVLSFTIKPNIYSNFASIFFGIKIINTVSGLGTIFLNQSLFKFFGKGFLSLSFKFAHKVIVLNKTDFSILTDLNLVKSSKLSIIPGSGIDTDKFNCDRLFNSGKTFLFVGRILKDKGILECILAFKKLLDIFPNIKLVIAGDLLADNSSALDPNYFFDLIDCPNITYFGNVSDVISLYINADVFVLPSYREGLSRSILEAASMKLPVVTTNVPGCRDIVIDEFNGYLCHERDVESLFLSLRKIILLSEPDRLRMGVNGRLLISKEYDVSTVNSIYINLLNISS